MEGQKPYLVMIFVQLVYAGMALFSKLAIGGGMSPFIFVVYRQALAAAFLAPFAYFLERKEAPHLHNSLLCKIFFTALCGITLSSTLYYLALRYTSATFAAASTNLIPAITFIMAVLFRMERVTIKELDGQGKVLGSVMCVAGALMVAFYQGPPVRFLSRQHSSWHGELPHPVVRSLSRMEWVKGCLLMLAANTAWSVWLVLQGALVPGYPAKLRLTALQCFFSALQSFALAIIVERHPSSWRLGWDAQLLSVLYCGVIVTGISYWLQVWCIEKKGPVFIAAFTPLALLMTAAFTSLLWNEAQHWGSIGGTLLMVGGLYLVLWGKRREGRRAAMKEQGQEAKVETQLERITIDNRR
uniref:WAT1-related protein n=2 Tax=Anthurium amnicola TaxID=1678845 RepID=A0A1D1XJJ8_9ARAE